MMGTVDVGIEMTDEMEEGINGNGERGSLRQHTLLLPPNRYPRSLKMREFSIAF